MGPVEPVQSAAATRAQIEETLKGLEQAKRDLLTRRVQASTAALFSSARRPADGAATPFSKRFRAIWVCMTVAVVVAGIFLPGIVKVVAIAGLFIGIVLMFALSKRSFTPADGAYVQQLRALDARIASEQARLRDIEARGGQPGTRA
jgi:Flp pilus assembly protein TadB